MRRSAMRLMEDSMVTGNTEEIGILLAWLLEVSRINFRDEIFDLNGGNNGERYLML